MSDDPQKRTSAVFKIIAGIFILIVAMGLLFPPGGRGLSEPSTKVQAKNDITQMVNAVRAFYTEYGTYPVDPNKVNGARAVTFGDASLSGYLGDNSAVLDVLRNNSSSPSNRAVVAKLNPRGIIFIEAPVVRNDKAPKAGVHSQSGVWYDPWGTPYNLAISTAYDDKILASTHGYTDANSQFSVVHTGVVAWSYGKDQKAGKMGNHTYAYSDDVISWQ